MTVITRIDVKNHASEKCEKISLTSSVNTPCLESTHHSEKCEKYKSLENLVELESTHLQGAIKELLP